MESPQTTPTYPHRASLSHLILHFCPSVGPAGPGAQRGSGAGTRVAWGGRCSTARGTHEECVDPCPLLVTPANHPLPARRAGPGPCHPLHLLQRECWSRTREREIHPASSPSSERHPALRPGSQSLLWCLLIFMAAWTECGVSERVSLGSRLKRAATHLRTHESTGAPGPSQQQPTWSPPPFLSKVHLVLRFSPTSASPPTQRPPPPCLTARTHFPFFSKCFSVDIFVTYGCVKK